ncbi:glucoamylase precursor [Aureobasidium pullulans]|uniref:glucan 1,4-alpha-glucosidase n=1 Tax=Aureobasidium pullulans TaxID=5580 RepID=A0A4S9YGW1_AURPU|nr:glucoamylase precursor [Aureobasidium pullulans]THW21757.1 glucoamylase precursor [Aureobasidium pullulans]THY00760.1 glucoamylase precursor [Aureobasidium pullulans]THZ70548.1 glucoamylase precursor [Aureobasidium pullulans]THZ91181.1 glucoamylase precursor [Aureobasidium pullulans]
MLGSPALQLVLNSSWDMLLRNVATPLGGLLAFYPSSSFAQNTPCQTTTVQASTPSDTNVALRSYSYCGGNLDVSVYIANVNYNKVVTLYYTDSQGVSTPLTSVALGYNSSIPDTNYEFWSANTPVYLDGITQLLNLTYQAKDIGQTYVQQLQLSVKASGNAPPAPAAIPAPYANPSGFSDDITAWLAPKSGSQADFSKTRMFLNINPDIDGAAKGTVVAARSGPSYEQQLPDYEYDWVRDSSLTMDVVRALYSASTVDSFTRKYKDAMFHYAEGRAVEQNDPSLTFAGLGEPKFYLNNTAFTGPWGRPQNDGPATAAITLIEFAYDYMKKGGSLSSVRQRIWDSNANPKVAPVLKDLLFVASNWSSPSFDLWEEEESAHFYTRLVQRRALVMGARFATLLGDATTSSKLSSAATQLTATLDQFWSPNRKLILYEYGPVLAGKNSFIDIAVILGVIHGYAGDGVYSYTNDRVLASALKISTSFLDVYGIAKTTKDSKGLPIGIPIGRYPEDVYNGVGTSPNGGNPWYLTTATMAQYLYSAASEYQTAGTLTVNNVTASFFAYYAPKSGLKIGKAYSSNTKEFASVIASLKGWGDAYIRRIKYHTPAGGNLAEEFNRNDGHAQGAADLTWSYASLLTAAFARAALSGDASYTQKIAALAYE